MTSLGKDIKELVDLGYDLTTAAEMAQNDRKGRSTLSLSLSIYL